MTKHFPLAVGHWQIGVEHDLVSPIVPTMYGPETVAYDKTIKGLPCLRVEVDADFIAITDIPIIVLKHWIACYEKINGAVE